MTISSTANRVSYTGNGVTTAFAYPYLFTADSDLVVIETIIATGVETTKALTTDYTVTGADNPNGGTVTAVTAPASTVTWTIFRDPPQTQKMDLVENDPLPAEALEGALDKLTMLLQRVMDLITRTTRQPDGDTVSIATLPAKVSRAGKFLAFDANGDPVAAAGSVDTMVVSPFMSTVLDDADAAAAKSTLTAELDVVNAVDFGADGSGTETAEVQAAITAAVVAGKPLVLPEPTYTTGALSTAGLMAKSRKMFFSDARGLAETLDRVDMSSASALTHTGEDFVFTYRNSNVSGNDVYAPIFPSIDHYDVVQGVCDIADGGTIEHATGLAGYVRNLDATVNGVTLFGCGYVDVDNGAIWGINTLLQDDAIRAVGTDIGRQLSNELDFNVMNPNTQVMGLTVGGNSLAQPTVANGFTVNTLGTGIAWVTGFFSQDGAAANSFASGMKALSGANIESQNVLFSSTDGASVKQNLVLRAISGVFLELSGTTLSGFKISSGDLLLDTGKSVVVNGLPVLSDRKTGWTAPTGTATRGTFDTGSVTLSALAEHVKALIDDTTSHGIIGA